MAWRTPDQPMDAVTPTGNTPIGNTPIGATPVQPIPVSADATLERGFVASLRWLVAEGDARGVRRIAVELRALREALATLDETRAARDDQARRAIELDKEIQAALAVLGPGTAVQGNGSIVQRLARLRERLGGDAEARRQLVAERDAFKAMCGLLTMTRARVHELLENSERERDELSASLAEMKVRVSQLEAARDLAGQDGERARAELAELRQRLSKWTGTVERALSELTKAAGELSGTENGEG